MRPFLEATSDRLNRARFRKWKASAFRVLFSDRFGFTVFVATLVFAGAFWRMGFAINDNETLANGVQALSRGQLAFVDPHFGGENGVAPGTKYHDGARYAREYGLVVPATIVAVVLQGLGQLFSISVLITGAWCLLLLFVVRELTRDVRYRGELRLAGALGVLLLFAANVLLATPIATNDIPLLALQVWTMLCCGFVGTVAYRLFETELPPRAAAAVGFGVVVATPVGFWATTPKRHVAVALAVLVVAYAFARRPSVTGTRGRLLRAFPYACVALLVWVHPGDGAILFVAVVIVDLVFGASYDRTQAALASGVFLLALLPFLITNFFVSGNPVRPPQFFPQYTGQPLSGTETGTPPEQVGGASGPQGGGSSRPDSSPDGFSFDLLYRSVTGIALDGIGVAAGFLRRAQSYAEGTLTVFVESPQHVFQTFVRSGYIERAAARGANFSYNLAYLESMPLFGAALVGGVHAVRRSNPIQHLQTDRQVVFRDATGSNRVLAFAVVYFSLMVLFYQNRLPLHATLTVRYLVPTMPLALYVALRLPALRDVLLSRFRTVGVVYGLTVLVGGELLAGVFVLLSLSVGEAIQLHALLALAMAGVLVAWCLVATLDAPWGPTERRGQVGAVLLGATAGTTTVFLLLTGWIHFPYGEYAIPIFDAVSQLLRSSNSVLP
jgi:hypothetical protein